MTAQDLYDKIEVKIEVLLDDVAKKTKVNYIATRKNILAKTDALWRSIALAPKKDAAIGNVTYVSKADAYKYGRWDTFKQEILNEVARALKVDVSNIEKAGIRIYETQYNGNAWATGQGYDLPLKGGVSAKRVAASVYSNFYGKPFDETVKANLGAYAQQILDTTTRALNQGSSYSKIATQLINITDKTFAEAERVARTEGGRIQSDAWLDSLELLDEVGVPYEKMWLATIDDRTREDHREMDGEMADTDGVFHLPSGATGPAPRETGNASDDINCRCRAVTVIDGEKPTERRVRGEGIVPFETFNERLGRGGNIPVKDVKDKR